MTWKFSDEGCEVSEEESEWKVSGEYSKWKVSKEHSSSLVPFFNNVAS